MVLKLTFKDGMIISFFPKVHMLRMQMFLKDNLDL